MESTIREGIWKCEFCSFDNHLDLDEEELPKASAIDYLLEPAMEVVNNLDDIVVFCIDVSGSMCCTSEVEGDFKIRTNPSLEDSLREFIETRNGELADQFLPNQARNVTYVSRLQCVQAAVSDQIERMAKENPNKRVAIVTFGNDITIFLPDGRSHVVTGDHLYDYDYLLSCVDRLKIDLHRGVKETEQELINHVVGLSETGATALGPALLTSIGIASKRKGSAVILCTDGIANIGLGSLEDLTDENALTHSSPTFYKQVALTAAEQGVSVSIVGIKGAQSRMEYIAKIAADTKGYNDILDPVHLTKGFNFILENKIVATDVSVVMILHKGLKFRHERVADSNLELQKVQKQVGNCTNNTILTFEYRKKNGFDLSNFTSLPFQIQIKYTKPETGTKYLRILSKTEKITQDRQEAERSINVAVVGLHTQRQASRMASAGAYTKARMKMKSNMRMVKKSLTDQESESQKKQLELWSFEAKRVNEVIKSKKVHERERGYLYASASDDDSDSAEALSDLEEEHYEKEYNPVVAEKDFNPVVVEEENMFGEEEEAPRVGVSGDDERGKPQSKPLSSQKK
eukprot:TRINITY_DN2209_c0_g1_i2.p1 TRINITY_DN2209_c0_g1~~TRINITY_DN2209_c0_g1_i2.p1  ORF type:complete len:574 (-),score=157.19 TRINITY_DN2209_c0_g1_i2:286-2007(-)